LEIHKASPSDLDDSFTRSLLLQINNLSIVQQSNKMINLGFMYPMMFLPAFPWMMRVLFMVEYKTRIAGEQAGSTIKTPNRKDRRIENRLHSRDDQGRKEEQDIRQYRSLKEKREAPPISQTPERSYQRFPLVYSESTAPTTHRPHGYISSSYQVVEVVDHQCRMGQVRVCVFASISSMRRGNDEEPAKTISDITPKGKKKPFIAHPLTLAATSFQNITISNFPCAFLYSINRFKNVTSSSVNATPFPVVLLYNALGGVGDLFRWCVDGWISVRVCVS
jgi:hypothetical protein